MATLARLEWVAQQVHAGRSAYVRFSYNPATMSEKVTFILDPWAGLQTSVYRPVLLNALLSLRSAIHDNIVTDKGHVHKSQPGRTCVEFWIKPAGITNSMKQHASNDTNVQNASLAPGAAVEALGDQPADDSMASVDEPPGTPDFGRTEHPDNVDLPALVAADAPENANIIEKTDWRFSVWTGLQTVISNFEVYVTVIERLRATPGAPTAPLQHASTECHAILGIARAQVQELLDDDMALETGEAKLVAMGRGNITAEHLMKRSDAMKERLSEIASGGPVATDGASSSACGDCGSGSSAGQAGRGISVVQCLMAPKSGRPHQNSKKPGKRSSPAPLRRNSDGKHLRR